MKSKLSEKDLELLQIKGNVNIDPTVPGYSYLFPRFDGGVDGNMRDYVEASPNAEEITAFSELFKASTHALEILNKILIQNKRSETSKEVKQMDIDSKSKLLQANQNSVLISRDDIVKKLMDSAHLIDAEVIDTD